MSQTLREMRELRRLDPSNHTLRFNRTRREAGMVGGIDDDAPTGAAIVWGLLCAVLAMIVVLAW